MSAVSSVARARCSALFTEATLVSSSSAASLACQRSTSQRISTARCCGGRCWSAATNASLIVSLAIAASAGSGVGSIHVTSGSSRRFSITGSPRRAEVHRPGAALARAEHVEADVGRDPVEPRLERRPALEALVAAPRADERLLHGVLGLERRAEHPVGVRGQRRPVLFELLLESGGRRFLHDRHVSGQRPWNDVPVSSFVFRSLRMNAPAAAGVGDLAADDPGGDRRAVELVRERHLGHAAVREHHAGRRRRARP